MGFPGALSGAFVPDLTTVLNTGLAEALPGVFATFLTGFFATALSAALAGASGVTATSAAGLAAFGLGAPLDFLTGGADVSTGAVVGLTETPGFPFGFITGFGPVFSPVFGPVFGTVFGPVFGEVSGSASVLGAQAAASAFMVCNVTTGAIIAERVMLVASFRFSVITSPAIRQ